MKKILSLIAVSVMLAGLCACEKENESVSAVSGITNQNTSAIEKSEDALEEINTTKETEKENSSDEEFNIDDFCGTFTNDDGSEITFSKTGDGYQLTNMNLMVDGEMKSIPDSRVAGKDELTNHIDEGTNLPCYELDFNDAVNDEKGVIATFIETDGGLISVYAWDMSMENWMQEGYTAFITFSIVR